MASDNFDEISHFGNIIPRSRKSLENGYHALDQEF